MSPLLKKVEKAGKRGIDMKRKPYKVTQDDFFNDRVAVRKLFSQIIDCQEEQRIAIVPSVSYGMANVVNNLPKKKGEIIVVAEQFPSNIYPWMSSGYDLKVVEPGDPKQRGKTWTQAIISNINEKTAAVALGHVHWVDGTLFDLKSIREATSKNDAALIIDGTQSIGALPFSVNEFKPDAVVAAGYKWLMGPYSIGAGYYGEMFDNGTPIEQNWIARKDSENFAGLVNYKEDYQPGALRYDVGEHSNFILLPMFKEALKQIIKWEPENIQNYCDTLMEETLNELSQLGYHIEDRKYRGSHLFGIRIPETISHEKLQNQLKAHKVSVSVRGTAIRVSPHVYNDEKDVSKFFRALKSAIDL